MNHGITIKSLRSQLKYWGNFWRSREVIKGYRTQSYEQQQQVSAGYHDSADNIRVPAAIEDLTLLISNLKPECIRALRAKYILEAPMATACALVGFESKRSAEFWLAHAERGLLMQM